MPSRPHRLFFAFVFVAAAVAAGAGCVSAVDGLFDRERAREAALPPIGPADVVPRPAPAESLESRAEPLHEVADGAWRQVLAVTDPSPVTVTLYRLDPKKFRARLVVGQKDAPEPLARLVAGIDGDLLAVNGTYFHGDNTPSGYVAVDGKDASTRAFDLDKSGIVVLAPEFGILDTRATPVELDAAELGTAVQSYPFLIAGGEPAIKEDSGQLSRRTFVGTDAEGYVWVGTVTDAVVSLYGLMRVLDASGIGFAHVMNLDGGPSTGFVARFGEDARASDSYTTVANAIVFVRR